MYIKLQSSFQLNTRPLIAYLVCTLPFCIFATASLGAANTVRQADVQKGEGTRRSRDELRAWRASIEFGKQLVKDRTPDEFLEWDFAELPNFLKYAVYSYSGSVLMEDANPFKRGFPPEPKEDMDIRVYVFTSAEGEQDDLVECRWTHNSRLIRVVESRNAKRIDFDLEHLHECQKIRGADCVAAAKQWVADVLKLEGVYSILDHDIEYKVALPWPSELEDGVSFSSAPEQEITRLRGKLFWHDRVDVFVGNGTLSILIYRGVGQRMGYPDGSKWFDDEFRAQVHAKARTLGKLPPGE